MMDTGDARAILQQGLDLLNQGQYAAARSKANQALSIDDRAPDAYFLLGLIALRSADADGANAAFKQVTRLQPRNALAWAHLAEACIIGGDYPAASHSVTQAQSLDDKNPLLHQQIGLVLSSLGKQQGALRWFQRALGVMPENIGFLLNLAHCEIFLGHIGAAGRTLRRLLTLQPSVPEAHWLLAGLEKAVDRRHIRQMQSMMAKGRIPYHASAYLNYACGKEYEDLEAWSEAFDAFERGAAAKRSIIEFDEKEEETIFRSLQRECTIDWLLQGTGGYDAASPIFVVGEPRSGTTLVDRIISAHPAVESAGELRQLNGVINRIGRYAGPRRFSNEAIQTALHSDPHALGRAYCEASAWFGGGAAHFVDKQPSNYLFIPIILKCLPQARIVHVRRGAMDTCFSLFKQLFTGAYPYSYDLEEIARHYLRYNRLTGVWRERFSAQFADRFHEVWYEDLVRNLESEARRLIGRLNLAWDPACLAFHEHAGPVTTASAVQVREKAHQRSIGRWHRHEGRLSMLIEALEANGVHLER